MWKIHLNRRLCMTVSAYKKSICMNLLVIECDEMDGDKLHQALHLSHGAVSIAMIKLMCWYCSNLWVAEHLWSYPLSLLMSHITTLLTVCFGLIVSCCLPLFTVCRSARDAHGACVRLLQSGSFFGVPRGGWCADVEVLPARTWRLLCWLLWPSKACIERCVHFFA